MKKLYRNKKHFQATILLVFTILAIAVYALFNTFIWNDEKAPTDKNGDKEGVVDVTKIPSYLELKDAMKVAVNDIYGLGFEELVTQNSSTFVAIPQTEILFNKLEVSDEVDLMALTKMALQRNPYIQLDEHPVPLRGEPSEVEGSLRVLPTGQEIDLARLEQHYSDIKLFITREDPTRFEVTGYDNGSYFEESVDLSDVYIHYITN